MLRKLLSRLLIVALCFGAATAAPMAAGADEAAPVGVAGAVNPRTDSTPPGGATRTVMVGAPMLTNERVVTGPQGSTQLVFIDHSTLTIGPDSDVVIDRFVFDPAAGTGKMAVSLGKGVLRLVGGEISHKDGAEIKTPSATVGIRGGIVMIRASGRETAVVNLFGHTTVSASQCDPAANPRCLVSILRPGFGTTVSSSVSPPASPYQVPSDQVMTLTAQLQSSPAQNGGAATTPTDATTQQAGTGQANSGAQPRGTPPQAPQGGGATPPDASSQSLAGTPGLFDTSVAQIGDITQQQQLAMNSGVEPTNFPDGTTSIGDLRLVTAPRVFTYSQNDVPIYFNSIQVGSYDFDMTINLGAPASRSLSANATNINVSGGPWPYAAVSNANLNVSLPAPDFQFAGSPVTDTAFGFGSSTGCASGVSCSFGVGMRNSGGHVAAFADHNIVVYPDSLFTEPPPVNTPGAASGSGTAPRVTH